LTAEDVQLIQARQWSVGDIARIFGVSPWVLGDSSRMTFASAREATRSHATLSLSPWASRVERAFSASVLTPAYRLRIDLGSLQRANTETLFSALAKARAGGWLSPNDCREESGWPRVDGADSLEPPAAGGRPAGDTPTDLAPAPADDGGKIADLAARRARHGDD
jgi:HK97 family phage portal protein